MAWADQSVVASVTNVSDASTAEIATAQALIELYLNRIERATDTDAWDYVWLQRAVAYQVPWMRDHPELFTILDVDQIRQGGTLESVQLNFPDTWSKLIAPLARLAAGRTRGGTMTTVHVGSVFDARPFGGADIPWYSVI